MYRTAHMRNISRQQTSMGKAMIIQVGWLKATIISLWKKRVCLSFEQT